MITHVYELMVAPVPTRATLGVGGGGEGREWGRENTGEISAHMVESHRAQQNIYFSGLTQFQF